MSFRQLCQLSRIGTSYSKLIHGNVRNLSGSLQFWGVQQTNRYLPVLATQQNCPNKSSCRLLHNTTHSPLGYSTLRHFSVLPKVSKESESEDKPEVPQKKLSIFQRFKDTYKQYGKVLIAVHCATSTVWFGAFYYAAYTGIEIVPLLEKIGAGETIINALGKPGIGHIAVAYLLYKLATPARYTVTVVGTQLTVKKLRQMGYMQPVRPEDSIRSLLKAGRSQFQERYDDMKGEMRQQMLSRREHITREIRTRRETFMARHSRLRKELERQSKLRLRPRPKNGKNGTSH